jgi:hypothetical protein
MSHWATEVGIYLVSLTIEDLGFFCGVADSLKDGGLARICSSHDENSKAPELPSKVFCRCHIV